MKMNYGMIFREIRMGKKYTLDYVASGISSVSLLSKFERGEIDISFTKMITLLERVNISLMEFELIVSDYKSSHLDKMIADLKFNYLIRNDKFIRKMMNDELELFKETQLDYHKLNSIMIKSILDDLNQTKHICKNDMDYVTDYLFSLENWSFYELILFSNVLNVINISTMLLLSKELINKTILFQKNNQYRKLIIETLINTCITLLENNLLKDYLYFSSAINTLSVPEEWLYERNLLLYLSGFYLCKIGFEEEGKIKIERSITIFEHLASFNLASNYQTYLE